MNTIANTNTDTEGRNSIVSNRIFPWALRIALLGLVCMLCAMGWKVSVTQPYDAGSNLGYNLGLAGGIALLTLLVYPMRKRLKRLKRMGAMLSWFRYHIVVGIAGPVLVLFHSTFHTTSMNGAVALYAMLLVVASGIVGRFVYRHIHRGLNGSILLLGEAESALKTSVEEVRADLVHCPDVEKHLDDFRKLAFAPLDANVHRVWRFMTLRARGHAMAIHASNQIRHALHEARARSQIDREQEKTGYAIAKRHIYAYVDAVCNASQLTSWERLFSLWHVVHLPFIYLLVFSGVVHVVAVHMY